MRPGVSLLFYASARGMLKLRPCRLASPAEPHLPPLHTAPPTSYSTIGVSFTIPWRSRSWARVRRLLPLRLSPILSGGPCALFIAARSRFAEDALGLAVGRGVGQLVVLGAGLDTFAYRNPHPALRVFEVDHPATQAWKRDGWPTAGIAVPPSLSFAAVDFERVGLAEGLAQAGFDAGAPAFFSWLGVVVYLSEDAIFETLGFIAGRPAGSEVVFSYSDRPDAMPAAQARAYRARAARVAALGEAWRTQFEPAALHARLRRLGFGEIEDLGPAEVAILYFGAPAGTPQRKGGHLIRARVG